MIYLSKTTETITEVDSKKRMTSFIAERLETSGLYDILYRDKNHILVRNQKDQQIYIRAHASLEWISEKNYAERLNNEESGTFVAHVFYKDGQTFFQRLAGRGYFKGNRNLKNYTLGEINRMVELRKIEKEILLKNKIAFTLPFPPHLPYYQPQTDHKQESIRIFSMSPVELNYDYLHHRDPKRRFAINKLADDWFLTQEVATVTIEPLYLDTAEIEIPKGKEKLKKD